MEKLVEIMLNEGLNDETIVNVLKAMVNEDAAEGSKSMSLLAFTHGIKKGATGARKKAVEKLIQDLTANIKSKKEEKKPATVSESCYNDIISIVEEILEGYDLAKLVQRSPIEDESHKLELIKKAVDVPSSKEHQTKGIKGRYINIGRQLGKRDRDEFMASLEGDKEAQAIAKAKRRHREK